MQLMTMSDSPPPQLSAPYSQAFLLISSSRSPLQLWASIQDVWSQIEQIGCQLVWSAPLYGRHGVGLYVTALSRQLIEAAAETLQMISSLEVDLRLCKDDGHTHGSGPHAAGDEGRHPPRTTDGQGRHKAAIARGARLCP